MIATTLHPFRRPATALAGLAVVAGLLAGCATAGTPAPTEDASAPSDPRARTSAVFSCLRDEGYEAADPDDDRLSIPEGVDREQYAEDFGDCSASVPGGGAGGAAPSRPDAADDAALAACMRQGGFPDYPDAPEAQAEYTTDDQHGLEEQFDRCIDQLPSASDTATPGG